MRARILTMAGWISADFHMPAQNYFLEHLNRLGEVIRLTNVTLLGQNPHVLRGTPGSRTAWQKELALAPNAEDSDDTAEVAPGQVHVRRVPFIAIHRQAIVLVLPPPYERDLVRTPDPERLDAHAVTCFLEMGLLDGTVNFLRGTRTSDFFQSQRGFVILQDCRLIVPRPPVGLELDDRVASVLVNSGRVLAISDGLPQA